VRKVRKVKREKQGGSRMTFVTFVPLPLLHGQTSKTVEQGLATRDVLDLLRGHPPPRCHQGQQPLSPHQQGSPATDEAKGCLGSIDLDSVPAASDAHSATRYGSTSASSPTAGLNSTPKAAAPCRTSTNLWQIRSLLPQ
jgi:hypothetical protein